MCALPSCRFVVVLKEIFLAARDGRVLSFDLLPLQAGGLSVCATAARIATHAHAMPCATQPAVTQASPILFGCRVHAGQVLLAEDHRHHHPWHRAVRCSSNPRHLIKSASGAHASSQQLTLGSRLDSILAWHLNKLWQFDPSARHHSLPPRSWPGSCAVRWLRCSPWRHRLHRRCSLLCIFGSARSAPL